jgi:hypothetical protein
MKVDADALLDACAVAASQGAYGISIVPEDDGWGVWSRSDSRISAVYSKLPEGAFPDGYVKGDGFSVKNAFFPEALTPGTQPDIVVGDGRLTVTCDKRKQTVRLDGLDANDAVKTLPKYTPMSTMLIEAADLIKFFKQKQIKDFKGVNGLELTLTGNGLIAKVEDERESFEDMLECDTVALQEEVEQAHAGFSVDALIPMILAVPKDAIVTVGFDTNCPIELTVDTDTFYTRMLLAPQIPEEY